MDQWRYGSGGQEQIGSDSFAPMFGQYAHLENAVLALLQEPNRQDMQSQAR
jgi:hypothetical protein